MLKRNILKSNWHTDASKLIFNDDRVHFNYKTPVAFLNKKQTLVAAAEYSVVLQ